jgi:hypothetical protein
LPWLSYKLKQRAYFKLALRKGKKQSAMERIQQTTETEEQDLTQVKRQNSIMNLFGPKKTATPNNQPISFKRPVLELKKGISDKQWELQQVELNAIRNDFKDLVDSYGEIFVLLSFITLFASAFPLGPLIALVNSIFDSR